MSKTWPCFYVENDQKQGIDTFKYILSELSRLNWIERLPDNQEGMGLWNLTEARRDELTKLFANHRAVIH